MKKPFFFIALPHLIVGAVFGTLGFNSFGKSMQMKTISIDANLLILENGGGNSIILTSEDGSEALVVDTKYSAGGKRIAALVKGKKTIVVNTHDHFDHTGGNKYFPDSKFIAGESADHRQPPQKKQSSNPPIAIKPGMDTTIRIGSETVHIRNMGRAHTWNDAIVYLENHKILVTGDIVFGNMHPAMFKQAGSKVGSWMTALDTLINDYPAARVLPGHGEYTDTKAIVEMKDYFTTMQTAIGNPEKTAAAKQQFRNYRSIPVLTGFGKTLTFIKNEKGAE